MNKILVDFNRICGRIKPMHAVNNVPLVPRTTEAMYARMSAAHIPYARLHDTGGHFGGAHYVDIANVFPDFEADETDAASYDFAFTDVLLHDMSSHGITPFYRLGATIENHHKIKAYHIYPPKDYAKWARICEHVIRHYNEGWAQGFCMNIKHWEIWNEPDNEPNIADNAMWKGTQADYFELYNVTARHLKSCFPHLKIGGYGSCGFYAVAGVRVASAANAADRTDYFVTFFHDFLRYVKEHNLPLDFFSWHSYSGVKENVQYAAYARQQLDAYGFGDCEIYLNEWNPGIENRGTQRDAAEILSVMCALQNTPTDMCMYYDLRLSSDYCGMFNPVTKDVFKAYYAFYVFGRLYALQKQADCRVEGDNIYALAAADETEKGVAIVNRSAQVSSVCLQICGGSGKQTLWRVDEMHEFVCEPNENIQSFTLPPYGIVYIEEKA